MAKLVDAIDSKSIFPKESSGSSPDMGTKFKFNLVLMGFYFWLKYYIIILKKKIFILFLLNMGHKKRDVLLNAISPKNLV